MQKEIQLTDKTLLVVGLPFKAKIVSINRPNAILIEIEGSMSSIQLPNDWHDGDWKLLGIYPELTEDMAHSLVEHIFDGNLKKYFNYKKGYYSHSLFTAKESFQSLMERENITGFDKYAILIKSK